MREASEYWTVALFLRDLAANMPATYGQLKLVD